MENMVLMALRFCAFLAVLVFVEPSSDPGLSSRESLLHRVGDVVEPSFEYLISKYAGKSASENLLDDAKIQRLLAMYSDFLAAQNTTQGAPDFDMSKYWEEHPEYALEMFGINQNSKKDNNTMSLLQVGTGKAQSACEVCVYVIENKEQHQPFLCRGLKAPSQQQTCVSVLVSLFWWLENQVYWVNYGCQRQGTGSAWEWVKPCPAHAVCSFIQSLYDRTAFCPTDPNYKKPSA